MNTFLIILLSLLGVIIAFYIAPALVMTWVIFRPQKGIPLDENTFRNTPYEPYEGQIFDAIGAWDRLPVQKIQTVAADGTPLFADYYPNGDSARVAVLFHGYRADPKAVFAIQAMHLYSQGFGLVEVHQRAQRGYPGNWVGLGAIEQEDVAAWCRWLPENTPAKELLVYGISMGAASVAIASRKLDPDRVKALILDSGFASPRSQMETDCRKRHLPGKLLMPLMGWILKKAGIDIDLSAIDALPHNTIPALFIQGTEDGIVPPETVNTLIDADAGEKELISVPGADHTMGLIVGGQEARDKLDNFILKHFPLSDK